LGYDWGGGFGGGRGEGTFLKHDLHGGFGADHRVGTDVGGLGEALFFEGFVFEEAFEGFGLEQGLVGTGNLPSFGQAAFVGETFFVHRVNDEHEHEKHQHKGERSEHELAHGVQVDVVVGKVGVHGLVGINRRVVAVDGGRRGDFGGLFGFAHA
jgi:hypothetical protein